MSSLLQIDISNLEDKTENDLIKIKFDDEEDDDEDILQVNFCKFFLQSKYIRDKYKYSEAIDSIESEIDEVEHKFNINKESIKSFIKLVQESKVNIPIEHYKHIYTLSQYFIIPKITTFLNNLGRKKLFQDLNFCIQILLDSESTNNFFDTNLTKEIENFLRTRINECIKNAKFKELPVSTIYRILDVRDMKFDHNLLVEFIFESIKSRFILFKFIELDKLTEHNIDEFISFIDMQDDDFKKMYFEYIPFNFSFIKSIKNQYAQVFKELNETKEALNRREEELSHYKTELEQKEQALTKINKKYELQSDELNQCKNEFEHVKDELDQFKNKYKQEIVVAGFNNYNQLGEKPNNKRKNDDLIIHPPVKLSLNPYSIQSYSAYNCHTVLVMNDGSLKGIGKNDDYRVSSTLQKTVIKDFTDFCIKDRSGLQLTAVSAACCGFGTLYMFSKNDDNERQLVLCDCYINGGDPVFFDIGNHHPVSLFGGRFHSAAICSEGEVIFINRNSIIKSPNSPIAAISLPNGEKASSVACCDKSVVVLSSNGRVFTSPIESNGVLNFSIVSELLGQEIVCVSGTSEHFLAVSKEGRVFGCGSNEHGKLGFGKETESVSAFTEIPSLVGYEIRAAYAGGNHSLFETREGKILSCGMNSSGQLLLSSGHDINVYSPTETTITRDASFCIAGWSCSIVFIGNSPPTNMPNIRIYEYK